jgi:hypothetical protein
MLNDRFVEGVSLNFYNLTIDYFKVIRLMIHCY